MIQIFCVASKQKGLFPKSLFQIGSFFRDAYRYRFCGCHLHQCPTGGPQFREREYFPTPVEILPFRNRLSGALCHADPIVAGPRMGRIANQSGFRSADWATAHQIAPLSIPINPCALITIRLWILDLRYCYNHIQNGKVLQRDTDTCGTV